MKLYRFSPLQDKAQLLEATNYIHQACHTLSKQILGEFLPNAGNIAVFCHYDNEYEHLIKIREELTVPADNIDQKYYRLHQPLTIPASGDIPGAIYTHLYIRKPDPYRHHVGDIDFYLPPEAYAALKLRVGNEHLKGIRMFDRPGWDMIELYDPDIDALAYISQQEMTEKVRIKTQASMKGNLA